MSKDPVNVWQQFVISGITYQVKTLGLLEISSMSATFYQKKLRKDLKEEADDFFGDSPRDRVEFINRQRDMWPKGDELSNLSILYGETAECQSQFCAYALNKFNRKQIPTIEKANEVLLDMSPEDYAEMFTCIFRGVTDMIDDSMKQGIKDAKDETDQPEKEETPEEIPKAE